MNTVDMMPMVLLVLFGVTFTVGLGMAVLALRRPWTGGRTVVPALVECAYHPPRYFVQRPACWVAVKNRSAVQVQAALGPNNPRPCSLLEGLAGDFKLFIAPPVRGWVLILGSGLPDPTDDPDVCFRFITALSRKLGHVQLFSASPILYHHAWVKADRGKIERAYAWVGRTIWNQGKFTTAERNLGMVCANYLEGLDSEAVPGETPAANLEKVPLLAAKWSIDPGGIEEQLLETGRGIAGEWSCRF